MRIGCLVMLGVVGTLLHAIIPLDGAPAIPEAGPVHLESSMVSREYGALRFAARVVNDSDGPAFDIKIKCLINITDPYDGDVVVKKMDFDLDGLTVQAGKEFQLPWMEPEYVAASNDAQVSIKGCGLKHDS